MKIPVVAKFLVEADDDPNAIGIINHMLKTGPTPVTNGLIFFAGISASGDRQLAAATNPRAHMRIQITKNTKGYQAETTVSLDWDYGVFEEPITKLEKLLGDADLLARREINTREEADERDMHLALEWELSRMKKNEDAAGNG